MIAGMMLAFAAATMQQQEVIWRGDLSTGQQMAVGNIVGDIRIEATSGRRAEVTATKRAGRRGDPEDVEIRAEETSDGVRICVRYPSDAWQRGEGWRCGDRHSGNNRGHQNDTRVDFVIRLPQGVRLDATTISGDIDARGLAADADVTTVSGQVIVDGFTGDELHARTVSGDVDLRNIRGRRVEGETVSGNVSYEGPVDRQGSYDFKSLSGRVLVALPEGSDADLRASTFSGRIRFPEVALSNVNMRRHNRASARIGEGGASLSMESFSGDVEVRVGR
ncbi:MAG: DUF4097 domain-containing protein [Gemmatimonadales bacterium]